MEEKRKIFGTIIGILAFVALMAGLTYAMLAINVNNSNTIAGTQCMTIQYTKGTDFNAQDLNFVDSYSDSAANTTVTFNQSSTCTANNIGTITIHTTSVSNSLITGLSTSGTAHGVLKYTIKNNSTSDTYTGYITNTGETSVEIGKLASTSTTYTIYLWLEKDSTNTITNSEISEATYAGYIKASAIQESSFK